MPRKQEIALGKQKLSIRLPPPQVIFALGFLESSSIVFGLFEFLHQILGATARGQSRQDKAPTAFNFHHQHTQCIGRHCCAVGKLLSIRNHAKKGTYLGQSLDFLGTSLALIIISILSTRFCVPWSGEDKVGVFALQSQTNKYRSLGEQHRMPRLSILYAQPSDYPPAFLSCCHSGVHQVED